MTSSEDTVEIPLIRVIDKTPDGVQKILLGVTAKEGWDNGSSDDVPWAELEYLLMEQKCDSDHHKWVKIRDSVQFDGHTVKWQDGYTGGEGGGESAYLVIGVTFPDGDSKFYMKTGYYASHYGTDWDGSFTEVTPKAVVKTEWM